MWLASSKLESLLNNFVLDNANEAQRRSLSRAGDRRASPRESVVLPALLVLENDLTASVTIVDRSLEGFRLDLGHELSFPDQFLLIDLLGSVGHEAQIAWRDGRFIGARSLVRHYLHELQEGLGARMKKVWARALS